MARPLIPLLLFATPLHAQDWRTLDAARQMGGPQAPLRVDVSYGLGAFDLRAAAAPVRYHVAMRYDAAATEPMYSYDGATGALRIGGRRRGSSVRRSPESETGELRVELGPGQPLDVSLDLSGASATTDLSGLDVRTLFIRQRAVTGRLRIAAPNSGALALLRIDAAGASFRASGLGNARARRVLLEVTAGEVDLAFDGAWDADTEVDLSATLAGVRLRVPADVGVRVEHGGRLGTVEHEGLIRRGPYLESANYARATHHLIVRSTTRLAQLTIDHAAP